MQQKTEGRNIAEYWKGMIMKMDALKMCKTEDEIKRHWQKLCGEVALSKDVKSKIWLELKTAIKSEIAESEPEGEKVQKHDFVAKQSIVHYPYRFRIAMIAVVCFLAGGITVWGSGLLRPNRPIVRGNQLNITEDGRIVMGDRGRINDSSSSVDWNVPEFHIVPQTPLEYESLEEAAAALEMNLIIPQIESFGFMQQQFSVSKDNSDDYYLDMQYTSEDAQVITVGVEIIRSVVDSSSYHENIVAWYPDKMWQNVREYTNESGVHFVLRDLVTEQGIWTGVYYTYTDRHWKSKIEQSVYQDFFIYNLRYMGVAEDTILEMLEQIH